MSFFCEIFKEKLYECLVFLNNVIRRIFPYEISGGFIVNEKNHFISLCSDTTFKYLLKKEETRNWILEIIERKTGIDLNEFQLINHESNTGNNIKDYRMDLVFEKGNTIVIVEMTNSDKEADTVKNYQYLYRTQSRRFMVGEEYTKKRTILILMNHFRNQESPNLLDTHFTFNDRSHDLLIKDIESFEIYLPNYKKTCYDEYNEIGRRLVLFNASSFEEMESITSNPSDLEIIKELRNLSMDEIFLTEYEKEKMQEKLVNSAYKEGLDHGIGQGKKDKQMEIAKRMLETGIDEETIFQCTGLRTEEITSEG